MKDEKVLKHVADKKIPIVIYEESAKSGGFGSSVLEYYVSNNIDISNISLMGIEDVFVEQGTKEEILKELKLDVVSIIELLQKVM